MPQPCVSIKSYYSLRQVAMPVLINSLQVLCQVLTVVPLLFSHLVLAANDTRLCYDVLNNEAPNHHPCLPPESGPISHCCADIDTCLGDTLCISQWGTLYVGTCTVMDWVSGNYGRGQCPKYCRNWHESTCNASPSVQAAYASRIWDRH